MQQGLERAAAVGLGTLEGAELDRSVNVAAFGSDAEDGVIGEERWEEMSRLRAGGGQRRRSPDRTACTPRRCGAFWGSRPRQPFHLGPLHRGLHLLELDSTCCAKRHQWIVLNRTAASVVEAQRGTHPTHVFAYRGKPTSHMLNGAWRRARLAAGLRQVRNSSRPHMALGPGVSDPPAKAGALGLSEGLRTRDYEPAQVALLSSRPCASLAWLDPSAFSKPACEATGLQAAKSGCTGAIAESGLSTVLSTLCCPSSSPRQRQQCSGSGHSRPQRELTVSATFRSSRRQRDRDADDRTWTPPVCQAFSW